MVDKKVSSINAGSMRFLSPSPILAAFFLAIALSPQSKSQTPIVRVHVLSRVAPQSLSVRATNGPLTVYANRESVPIHTLLPGEAVTMDRVGDRIRITTPTGSVQARAGEVVPSGVAIAELRTGTHRREYHGALSIEIDDDRRAMRMVNYVPIEDYVASVVASEYPFTEIAGVKAQAILARTYALRASGRYDSFDLYDDTRSQVYEGAAKETDVTRRATEETRGQVLTYGGALVEALYSSSSGGHTASNQEIWNTSPVPYLQGRPDPYDSAAPDHRWSTSAPVGELHRALGTRFGGTVTGIEVSRRSPSGRALTVRLSGSTGRTISASQFREVVTATFGARTLRSTYFTADRSGNRYTFSGRGFGHGVGMSQYGARGQAQAGRSCEEILAFYFPGTNLDLRDSTPLSRPDIAATSPRRTRPTPRAEALAERNRPTLNPQRPENAPTWSSGSETTAPLRRTAW